MPKNKSSPPDMEDEVAAHMAEQVTKDEWGLDQPAIVFQIKENFGDEFVYDNSGGNMAINRKVLAKFRKLTRDDVIWDGSLKVWRKRAKYDMPGRRQG